MKIGILTFHRGPNYGGYLQAWSMRKAIESFGHEVEIINYKNALHHDTERFKFYLTKNFKALYHKYQKNRAFEKVYSELSPGKLIHDSSEIEWSRYSKVVVGSDVVWDTESIHYGSDPIYFGKANGADLVDWISYAPSCGKANPKALLTSEKRDGLSNLKSIYVRDENTQCLVETNTGEKPTIVVDPTWITGIEVDIDSRFAKELHLYGYGNIEKSLADQIKIYAKKHGLTIVSYGYRHDWADKIVMNITPMEWLVRLRSAHSVITTTFHGTLYALKYNKAFVTIANQWSQAKVRMPLQLTDTLERMVTEDMRIDILLDKHIEESKVNPFERTLQVRRDSLDLLKNALSE